MIGLLNPSDTYYYAHNPMEWIEELLSMGPDAFPQANIDRILIAWVSTFLLDDSGRSTAKTYDHILIALLKCTLFPRRKANLFSMDKNRGVEIMKLYIGMWIEQNHNLAKRLKNPYKNRKPKISENQKGARIGWNNGSIFMTYTPGLHSKGDSAQSDRSNHLIFNEWSSWGDMDTIVDSIEPINTYTNNQWATSIKLRIATERALGIPLGRLTNDYLIRANEGKPNYQPRRWLLESKPIDIEETITAFKRNFKLAFLFDCPDKIESVEDLETFFALYLDGDPVYQNQIIYDGSAKRPSDESYIFHEEVQKKIDPTHEDYDPHYGYYNCGIDDIPEEWDGIIFTSAIVRKARKTMLKEDFDRVWGGKWTEGQSHRPFDPADVKRCRTSSINIITERPPNDKSIYILTVDSAKGTEAMRKGASQENLVGKGDSGASCIIRVGEGTKECPDEVVHVWRWDGLEVKKDPMAFDIHQLQEKFGFELIVLDPNGGGGDLADCLMKPRLDLQNKLIDVVPIISVDYPEPSKYLVYGNTPVFQNMMFFSRSTEMINLAYMKSEKVSPFRDDGELKSKMIDISQSAFSAGRVNFPEMMTKQKLIELRNKGDITLQEQMVTVNLEDAITQFIKVRFEVHPRTRAKLTTQYGMFKFKFPKRKDLSIVILYGLIMADVYRRFQKLVKQHNPEGYALAME